MARAGLSRRSLRHPQLAAIRLRWSLCTLAGNWAPTASPGDRTLENKPSGRGPAALASTPETLPAQLRRPSINYAARSPLPARPDVLCNLGAESSPAPTLWLTQVGEGPSSWSQPGVCTPSPPGGVATPHRVFFPSVGWVHTFTLM
jgi:hypothetical protein|uniref:Uncharacterized protein n=1 Tax=Mus musculus TaxID=10090 RepID=Q9CZ61_MOUSE|nr:unnamed protein product [Mus musculus]